MPGRLDGLCGFFVVVLFVPAAVAICHASESGSEQQHGHRFRNWFRWTTWSDWHRLGGIVTGPGIVEVATRATATATRVAANATEWIRNCAPATIR